jgi:hypothetical protein
MQIEKSGGVPAVEKRALLKFFESTGGNEWKIKTGWDGENEMDVAEWEGVTVSNGKVSEISLPGNNLKGEIPECLIELMHAHGFDFSSNSLSGVIPMLVLRMKVRGCAMNFSKNGNLVLPPDIGALGDVGSLDLSHCSLSGIFPDALFDKLFTLYFFNLKGNNFEIANPVHRKLVLEYTNFTELEAIEICNQAPEDGTVAWIPPSFNRCGQLKKLKLEWNALHGQVPELMDCANLVEIDLGANNLTGEIPWPMITELVQRCSLCILKLGFNQFNGMDSFPSQAIASLSHLRVLDLASTGLAGPIAPVDAFGGCLSLVVLDLSFNLLTGPVPDFSTCSHLEELRLSQVLLSVMMLLLLAAAAAA